MKKIILFCLFVILLIYHKPIKQFLLRQIPAQWCTSFMIYESIQDLHHPTVNDYHRLQTYLCKGIRPHLSRLQDSEKRMRKLRLIAPGEVPQYEKIVVNCDENDRTNCLIVYASFNKSFPQGLKRLVDQVACSDFKGHILYRIGGWPNVEEGDLKLAHVPYAFKPCFFKEARRLGYQRVLWLDTSIKPLVSLNQIFQEIEKKGCFTLKNGWMVGPFMNAASAAALGVTIEKLFQIPSCSAGLLGFDFSNPKATCVFDAWYAKAHDKEAYFTPRPEQNVLSILLYQQRFYDLLGPETMVEANQPLLENSLFLIDRNSVHQ